MQLLFELFDFSIIPRHRPSIYSSLFAFVIPQAIHAMSDFLHTYYLPTSKVPFSVFCFPFLLFFHGGTAIYLSINQSSSSLLILPFGCPSTLNCNELYIHTYLRYLMLSLDRDPSLPIFSFFFHVYFFFSVAV